MKGDKEVEVWIGDENNFYLLVNGKCYLLYLSMLHNWNIVVLRNAVLERQTPSQLAIRYIVRYAYDTTGYDDNFEHVVRSSSFLHLLVTQGITAQQIYNSIDRLNKLQVTKTFIKKAKGYE